MRLLLGASAACLIIMVTVTFLMRGKTSLPTAESESFNLTQSLTKNEKNKDSLAFAMNAVLKQSAAAPNPAAPVGTEEAPTTPVLAAEKRAELEKEVDEIALPEEYQQAMKNVGNDPVAGQLKRLLIASKFSQNTETAAQLQQAYMQEFKAAPESTYAAFHSILQSLPPQEFTAEKGMLLTLMNEYGEKKELNRFAAETMRDLQPQNAQAERSLASVEAGSLTLVTHLIVLQSAPDPQTALAQTMDGILMNAENTEARERMISYFSIYYPDQASDLKAALQAKGIPVQ